MQEVTHPIFHIVLNHSFPNQPQFRSLLKHPFSKSLVNQHVHAFIYANFTKIIARLLLVPPNFFVTTLMVAGAWRGAEMAIPSAKILFSLFPVILLQIPLTTNSQQLSNYACVNSANYTPNSIFRSNLQTALSSLRSNTATNYGFYNTTAPSQNPGDTVNALALCRGDVSQLTCSACVNDATVTIVQDCPNQMQAVGWYDYCMVRYWNATVFNRVHDPYYLLSNTNNVSSTRTFNEALSDLIDRLNGKAAAGGEVRKFATGNISGPDFATIFGLMQCTPDLSEADCRKCLETATAQIPNCCSGKMGGQVIGPSCLLRFEVYRFTNETENPVPQPPPPPSGSPPPPPPSGSPPPPGSN